MFPQWAILNFLYFNYIRYYNLLPIIFFSLFIFTISTQTYTREVVNELNQKLKLWPTFKLDGNVFLRVWLCCKTYPQQGMYFSLIICFPTINL
jgi:hypothetical protein